MRVVFFFLFQMINAVTDVQEDTVVEVVINVQHLSEDDVEIRCVCEFARLKRAHISWYTLQVVQ